MGVSVESIDPSITDGRPLGYHIFQQEVPKRSLFGANYLVGETPTPVLPGGPLFAGYKDLVMLFDLLAAYGDSNDQLARYYVMRAQGTDLDDALVLINETQERLYVDGHLLLGIFDPGGLPGPGDASGLAESMAAWRHSMRELQATRDFILGGTNLLGYSDDFLMLVQTFQPGGGPGLFDSYDALVEHVTDPQTGPLTVAIAKNTAAENAYTNYIGHQDQLATQFHDRTNSYNTRLFQIVGANRGEPGYDTPPQCEAGELNEGSENCLQRVSIDVAINRIERNGRRIENLKKQVEYEIDRRARVVHDPALRSMDGRVVVGAEVEVDAFLRVRTRESGFADGRRGLIGHYPASELRRAVV